MLAGQTSQRRRSNSGAVFAPGVGRTRQDQRAMARPLPPGDVNQFAMMGVNPPTAYLLLTDIVKLPRGSWVIQNGANSGVGRATVAVAKLQGLKTVNVVRRDEVDDPWLLASLLVPISQAG